MIFCFSLLVISYWFVEINLDSDYQMNFTLIILNIYGNQLTHSSWWWWLKVLSFHDEIFEWFSRIKVNRICNHINPFVWSNIKYEYWPVILSWHGKCMSRLWLTHDDDEMWMMMMVNMTRWWLLKCFWWKSQTKIIQNSFHFVVHFHVYMLPSSWLLLSSCCYYKFFFVIFQLDSK